MIAVAQDAAPPPAAASAHVVFTPPDLKWGPAPPGIPTAAMAAVLQGNPGEAGEFTGEPPRTDLTAPPPGYQTPSPAQPYGVGSTKERAKNPTIEDRMTGYGR